MKMLGSLQLQRSRTIFLVLVGRALDIDDPGV